MERLTGGGPSVLHRHLRHPLCSALVEKATGKKIDPDMIERTVRKVVEDNASADSNGAEAPAKDKGKSGGAKGKPDSGSGG